MVKIDYPKLAVLLLPTFLRGKRLISLVQVIMQPLQYLHNQLQNNCTEHLYLLQHTAQICHIKHALNSACGITDYQQGFEIQDINAHGEWLMTYDETTAFVDNHLIAHDATQNTLSDQSTITVITQSFAVLIPTYIYNDPDKMAQVRYLTNRYRLASRLPHYALGNDKMSIQTLSRPNTLS
ncbi:MAG: hypothetical protein NC038_05450 [Paludibacter sp.]|nr:hypothetical protein [Bacteroidales bacterium]MCM1069816.1 hypothetical protein [Prevotella sp.]MCM1353990.1 hypothetical protein [Bacteroides sp.]MCM1443368.1 hypothetical protein [Muribaculum sp.]MCM1482071.1 hypothetical protein [Paludibacter sp.]